MAFHRNNSGTSVRSDLNMRKLSFLGFGTDGNGDPDEVQLDAEMEKVFAGPDRDKDKFDLSQFGSETDSQTGQHKFHDKDVDAHRNQSYPHAARKPIISSMKRKDSKESSRAQSFDTSITTSPSSTATGTPISSPLKSVSHVIGEDNGEALVSERAGHSEPHSDSETEDRRVQFDKTKMKQTDDHVDEENDSYDENHDETKKKIKGRHQHFKRRKSSLQDHQGWRRQSEASTTGSIASNNLTVVGSSGSGPGGNDGSSKIRRVSIQPEDAELEEADIDELTSHRSDDPRGMRRHKVQSQVNEKLIRRDTIPISPKKCFDHSPHEVFVQLDELQGLGEEREWKETARWIKYEEDVEEGSDRWGRPHVASLSFHSLLNLRRCLETGVVLLDLEERDLPGVAYRVVEQMVVEELIQDDDKPTLMRALLLRHRHVNENAHGGFPFGSRRKFSSYTSLQYLWDEDPRNKVNGTGHCSIGGYTHSQNSYRNTPSEVPLSLSEQIRRHSTMSHKINLSSDSKPRIVPSSEINGHAPNHSTGEARIDMREETYSSSQEDLKKITNDTILKRIPVGAEATTVLVGAVDFLKQPTIAFVRLAEGIPIPGVTEVPIPVRFIFILLGPKTVDLDYHEVGRAIATLMSNQQFHKIAYKADDRRDLLSAINEFLDDSIVLPPGNWQRNDLLPFEELKAKSEWIRSRKTKALQQKNKDKQAIQDEEKKLLAALDDGGDGRKWPSPLEKTHRPWGGLYNDIRRRLPMYKSDILDGLNSETLAATIFMYFAALSTAITFGGLASDKTKNLIGISETLLAGSMVGLVFHAFAGQPLTIIGTTGPLLLFDEALYQFCLENNMKFLTVRVYIGVWLGIIALAVSAVEGSVYVRLFTRFTQELFSALITLIYIVETGLKLVSVFNRHPLMRQYLYTDTPGITLIPSSSPYSEALVLANHLNETSIATTSTTTANPINVTQLFDGNLSAAAPTVSLLLSRDLFGERNQPNTALFCTFLTLGTFTVAYFLRIFRNSHFLGRNARRALGDFGVPIAIFLFVTVDYLVPQVYTEKLRVPEGISPSDTSQRGWIIPVGDVPAWLPFASGIPAMLVYILVFMETHISELIVDKPERGLKKGSGLHFDIVLLCFLNIVCGFLGMPWHCAATVRSVTHVSAVTIMSRTHAPGDKPHITDVKEQRVSGFCVSLLVGLSVAAAPLLRLIPMSVLFGVFLYMGIASMSGVQFFERLGLFFMPTKYHPPEAYVRRVPTWKMHIFTMIQVLALAILWTIKSSSFSLAFPFVLILMVPLRQRMVAFFNQMEMDALDGSQPSVDPNDEPDFYEQAPIPA